MGDHLLLELLELPYLEFELAAPRHEFAVPLPHDPRELLLRRRVRGLGVPVLALDRLEGLLQRLKVYPKLLILLPARVLGRVRRREARKYELL